MRLPTHQEFATVIWFTLLIIFAACSFYAGIIKNSNAELILFNIFFAYMLSGFITFHAVSERYK